jgi:hydrogenase expression/formation protein HypC
VIAVCLGIPGRIVTVTDATGLLMGTADFGGLTREVCLAYVPEAQVGDYVVVHVGFAISLVDEAEAHLTLEILRSLGGTLDAELSPEDALPAATDPPPTGPPPTDGGRTGGAAA